MKEAKCRRIARVTVELQKRTLLSAEVFWGRGFTGQLTFGLGKPAAVIIIIGGVFDKAGAIAAHTRLCAISPHVLSTADFIEL